MTKSVVLQQILAEKLVVIIRLDNAEDVFPIVNALAEGGVKVVEVTANTPGFEAAITKLRSEHPDLIVGAGSVISPELVDRANAAGAQFIVTPNTRASVVERSHQYELPVLMGAMTPSEVVEAEAAGADVVKLFPAGQLGPKYLSSLAKGPLTSTTFFAVGGVDENNVTDWLAAGAVGVGVGGSLATPVKDDESARNLTERARKLVSALR